MLISSVESMSELETIKKPDSEKQELSQYEECRNAFIIKVQSLYKEGYTKIQITMLNTTFTRLRKYLNRDSENLSISGQKNNIRGSKLYNYKDTIV